MSAPPDAMTQILQGLLGDQQQAPQGGLMGALNQALAPYGGSNQVALSLLGNKSGGSSFGSILGQSLQDSQKSSLDNQAARLKNAAMALSIPQDTFRAQLFSGQSPGGMQGGQGQPSMPFGMPGGMQPGARPNVPVPQEQQPKAAPTPYDVPQGDIDSLPVYGLPPQMAANYMVALRKDMDPAAAREAVHKMQLQAAAQRVAAPMNSLDTVIQSASPTQIVNANPGLKALWTQLAPTQGMDPGQGFTDDNVRAAFGARRNELATSALQSRTDMKPPLKNITLPDGRTAQVDQISGKEDILSASPLEKVVGPNGPVNVPLAKAAGTTPYNPSTAIAGSITDQAKEQAYQRFKATGDMPASGRGGAASQTAYANYFAQRAAEDGDTGAAQAARSQQYKASQGVVKDFTSGKTSQTLNGLNTAIGHMDLLDKAATALQNNDVQGINKLKNFLGTQFGNTNANNFNVIRDFAAGEIAKAVLPGGGGEGERDKIAAAVKSSNSPAQLHQAIADWKDLLASKTDSIRNQWDVGTNGAQGSFDKFLLPATKKALGMPDAPASGAVAPGQSRTIGGFTVTRVK